jgi:hypothetical protein
MVKELEFEVVLDKAADVSSEDPEHRFTQLTLLLLILYTPVKRKVFC